MERLNLLKDFDFNLDLSPWDLVRAGLVDCVKVFVKNEPHKASKLSEGRVRLIFSVSLIDNVIATLLSSNQNNAEKSMWQDIPCKSGMGLDDSGLRQLNQTIFDNLQGGLCEADVSGWDFCFQEQDFIEDLKRRTFLNNGHGTVWEQIAKAHWFCMARKVMVLSDGSMYEQIYPGIMPSGWKNTTSTNTSVRAICAYDVIIHSGGEPFGIFMGDDGVERSAIGAVAGYLELGKIVKMYAQSSFDSFEFCSMKFDGNLAVPLNVDKQLVNLFRSLPASYEDALDRYSQFEFEFRNHPEKDRLMHFINSSGWWNSIPKPVRGEEWYEI
jgi:hypothetical protein